MNQLPCKNCGCWEDDFSLYGGLCVDCLLKENQQLKEQLADGKEVAEGTDIDRALEI